MTPSLAFLLSGGTIFVIVLIVLAFWFGLRAIQIVDQGTERTVLRLDRRLAPVKVAVLPLSKKDTLLPTAEAIAADLRKLWNIDYDTAGAIGRRYRRQDEIGTPFCVTVDFDSLEDRSVTVRERDTMAQDRVDIDELPAYLGARLVGC